MTGAFGNVHCQFEDVRSRIVAGNVEIVFAAGNDAPVEFRHSDCFPFEIRLDENVSKRINDAGTAPDPRIGICSRDNSSAAVKPVGPAPTMRTFGC
jgi:hypothetical protein